ncbi:hypothetical protein ARSEF1564_007543 [Beauveria bassiana]
MCPEWFLPSGLTIKTEKPDQAKLFATGASVYRQFKDPGASCPETSKWCRPRSRLTLRLKALIDMLEDSYLQLHELGLQQEACPRWPSIGKWTAGLSR